MKKLLLITLFAISALSVAAQQKSLTLVMDYQWKFNTKTQFVKSEGKCEDGIEFDFTTSKVKYYTPAEEMSESLCKLTKVIEPTVNDDKSTTYEYIIYMIGAEKSINCVLNVSQDLKEIKFTMIEGDYATVYRVKNMMTEDN